MPLHREANGPAAIEFRAMLGALGLAQQRVAEIFDVRPRNLRRWRRGDRPIPHGVRILLRLLAIRAVTVAQVEEAAEAVISLDAAAASGNPFTVDKVCALKAAISLDTTAAPRKLSTADKVCALAPRTCRWPIGDPARVDFRFCGASILVENSSYCDRHRATAYHPRITKVAA
jgi:hypothetical protein